MATARNECAVGARCAASLSPPLTRILETSATPSRHPDMTARPMSSAALVLSIVAVGWSAQAATLDLKRVMLSSGGVGYFEYEAAVTGDDALTLDVRLDH